MIKSLAIVGLVLVCTLCCSSLTAQTYPMNQQDPAASFSTSMFPLNYQFGWQFKANAGGINILRLGTNFPAASAATAKIATLFDASTQQVLAQVVCGPGSGWQFTDLASPVALTNGGEYIIAVFTQDNYYFANSPPTSWQPTGDIEYLSGRYSFTSNANTFPSSNLTGIFGVVDFGYVTGLTVVSNSQLPVGAETASYSTNIQAGFGSTPYTWTPVTSGLPNGLTLTQMGDEFQLTGSPAVGTSGTYNFDVTVTDAANASHTKNMSLYILPQPSAMPFTDDFSTDTGWQYEADWTRGGAQAYSATTPARTEPGTDNSPSADNNIAGHIIGNDYAPAMNSTVWLTSPPVNCLSATAVSLRYARWLGCSVGDTAKIQISNDGSTWNDIWTASGGSNTNDSAWTLMSHDITAWAAGEAVVRVRFGIGPTNTIVNTGWCIDDLELIEPAPELEVREGGLTGTIITDNETVGGLRDFGQVGISTNSTTLVISLTNNSANTITFGAWTKTGTNPAVFYVIAGPPSTLAPNANGTIEVQFHSAAIGVFTATINLPHDAAYSGSTPFEINVRAEAISIAPLIDVSDGSSLVHNESATGARDFGNTLVGSTSASTTITVSSSGALDLVVSTPALAGPDAAQFSVDLSNFSSTITPNSTTNFDISFYPTSSGTKNATISFTHNDTSVTSPFIINIIGDGVTVAPIIVVRETDVSGNILANPAPAAGVLDFGSQDVSAGATAAAIIYVENTGTAALTLGTPAFSAGATNFVLDTTGFPSSLAVGANASFSITFDPTQEGTLNAVIEFTHNDGTTGSPFVLNLTGDGVAPEVEAREGSTTGTVIASGDPAILGGGRDLGSIDVSAAPSSPVVISLRNTGSLLLILGTPTLTGTHAADFILNTTGMVSSLAVGADTIFTIAFDPTLGGIKAAQIEFTHNDPASPSPFIIPVIGTAIAPAGVQISTTSLPTGTSGVVYAATQLSAIQGTAPYAWSVYSGSLPTGLTLSAGGVVSGVPTTLTATTYNLTVRVADSSGATHERQFSIAIAAPLSAVGGSAGGGAGGCVAVGGALVFPLLLPLLIAYRRRRRDGR